MIRLARPVAFGYPSPRHSEQQSLLSYSGLGYHQSRSHSEGNLCIVTMNT
jgi:hypothetical protein